MLTPSYPPSREELAVSLRAVVGALAATQKARAEQLVVDVVASQLQGKDVNSLWEIVDPMRMLTGLLEEEGRGPPEARLLWKSGPGTILAAYRVGVYSDRELVGESPGETLEIAEEMAARDALRNIFQTTEHGSPLPWARLPSSPVAASL